MYTEFKIISISSWAEIELRNGADIYKFHASYLRSNSFNDLLVGLTQLVNKRSSSVIIEFDLEQAGYLEMLLHNYPNGLLKLEVFENIDWEQYEEEFANQTLPEPVFESIIPQVSQFAYYFIKEIERHGKAAFEGWDNELWEEQIKTLKDAINWKKEH